MTYTEAEEKLTGRERRRMPGRATYLIRLCKSSIGLKFHDTVVVRWFRSGKVRLDSGNWRTPTTKSRLTEYSGWQVFQERAVWYVKRWGAPWRERTLFRDGMILP